LGDALLDFSQPAELAAIALLNPHNLDRSAEVDDGEAIAILLIEWLWRDDRPG
jgi:hypothetical protein